ncbi:cupin domain-containing protein [Pseudomonas sp. URMO17WK12:I4]|uniref:cupin domain-containing protein n=1 Tax=Pseudomonas sp. URMO17WK12:I4 TaxID=1283292 RepID=UPI0004B22EF5|nr:cupin domain-containing protein [Pseudomonas sp. URMO17WK12:I4]
MTPIKQGTTFTELDAWGTVADLGSEILDGDGKIYGKMTFGAPTDALSAGYFAVTKSKFRMVYPFNEQATVVFGEVILTDEGTGQSKRYKEGDSWFVTKGTPVLWEVLSDSFTKHYMAAV